MFLHSGLSLVNVLGDKIPENKTGKPKYFNYTYRGTKYQVPAEKFNPKINDFDGTDFGEENSKIYKNMNTDYKDLYPFIFEVYRSITDKFWYREKLISDEKHALIKNYFNAYFDIDKVTKFTRNNLVDMYWNWNQTLDPEFVKTIGLKHPDWLLKNYFGKYIKS